MGPQRRSPNRAASFRHAADAESGFVNKQPHRKEQLPPTASAPQDIRQQQAELTSSDTQPWSNTQP